MRLVLLTGAAFALIVGCSNPAGGDTCGASGADVVIDAQDVGGFSPATVTVTAGQLVCWQNLGTKTHTVTTTTPASDTIDGTLAPHYLVTHVFSRTGSDISYHCTYHSTETGLVQVR
jgi:plastocyanin